MLASSIEDEKMKMKYFRGLLASLPLPNRHLTEYLLNFLMIVNSFSETNKLTIENITILFGPLFLADPIYETKKLGKKKIEMNQSFIEVFKNINNVTLYLLQNYSLLFQNLDRSGLVFAKAKQSVTPKSPSDLKFKKGDIIAVFHKQEDLWFGECRLKIGSFDPQLVTKIESTF